MSSSVNLDLVSSLIDVLRVNTFIDIGCICGLTPAGQSNPNGWVIELNSNEEVSRGIGFMLMQHQFSLAWVSFMVRVNLVWINFRAPWFLKPAEPLFSFHHFVWIQHQLQAQVWGRSLNIIIAIHIRDLPHGYRTTSSALTWHGTRQGHRNQPATRWFGWISPIFFESYSMCTLLSILPNSWVWI